MKKYFSLLLAIVLGITLVACNKKTDDTTPTAVSISGAKTTLTVGDEQALSATVTPSTASQSVSWASSDTAVATVSSSGVVKALEAGTVTITATSKAKSDVKASVNITVEAKADDGITSITVADKTIAAGKSYDIEAFDQKAQAIALTDLTITSSDEKIATVANGTVTTVAEGEATLTITLKANTAISTTAKLTVTAAGEATVITKMTMSEAAKSVFTGRTVTFYAVDQDKAKVDNALVTWSSDNEEIATVDEKGVVTAVAEGSANITVTLVSDTTIKASAIVVVEASGSQAPESIEVTADSSICALNGSLQLTATVNPEGASQDVEWTSSDTTIATVSTKGVVAGIAEGTVTIYAVSVDDETIIGQIELTIQYVKPEAIEINAATTCQAGKTITISYSLFPEGASVGTVTWSVDQPDYASVTVGTKATRLKIDAASSSDVPNGFIELTVTHTDKDGDEITANAIVEVNDGTVVDVKAPESISITGSPFMSVGDNMTLKKSVLPAGAKQTATWTSSDETIATVDNGGKVTAVKEGVVYITATTLASAADGSKPSATYKITVKAVPEIGTVKDMNGYALNVFQAEGAIYECDPRYDGSSTGLAYTNIDKEAKIAAWEYVEATWNCKLGVKAYPSAAPWGPLRIAWMGKNITTNVNPTNDYGDNCAIFIGPTDWLPKLSASGAIQDCTEFYEKYGYASMPTAIKEASTYDGKVYAMTQETDIASINFDLCLVYNYGLIEKYGLESPAKLFSENKWTYDDFLNYCETAYAAMSVDSDMTVCSGQACLWWIGMTNTAGVKLADVEQMTMDNIYSEVSMSAADTISKIYANGWWGTEAWDAGVTSFNNQQSIFQSAYWWFINSGDRFTKNYWGDNTQYGIVPFPYPSTISNSEVMVNAGGQSIFMLATQPQGYPDGITYEDVYKAWYVASSKTSSNLREDLSYNYDEKMYELAEAKLSDPYSVQVAASITENQQLFDPIYYLTLDGSSIHMSKLQPCLQNILHGDDFTEAWATYIDDYRKALQQSFAGTAA